MTSPQELVIDEELELLLDLILGHKLDYTRTFLEERAIPKGGTREELRERIKRSLPSNRISTFDLIWLLDRIEGLGNQQVYLYQASDSYAANLQDGDRIRETLTAMGSEELFNDEIPLFLPNNPTLAGVSLDQQSLRVKYVEKRERRELLDEFEEDDINSGRVFVKRYKVSVFRGVTQFRLNFNTGRAELMIQRLPSGTKYGLIRDQYKVKLASFVDIDALTKINTDSSILAIEQSGEAERRGVNLQTTAGSRVAFRSRGKNADYNNDNDLQRSRNALGDEVVGEFGNFYWLPGASLEQKVHTYIYKDRVGIFGEYLESEIDYVLSRIRHFAED